MKRMAELFKRVLEKYKLQTSVDAGTQKYMLSLRRRELRSLLKRLGVYGPYFGISIYINLKARKIGFRLSMARSKALAAGLAFIITMILSSGVYLAAKYLLDGPEPVRKNDTEKTREYDKTYNRKDTGYKANRKTESIEGFRIGVEPFQGADDQMAREVTDKIAGELELHSGRQSIINLRKGRTGNFNYLVIGSYREYGGAYIISAKLVDVETSRILTAVSESVESPDDIEEACRRISKKLAEGTGQK